MGIGNLLNFMHAVLKPMDKSLPSEGMRTVLMKLATETQLSTHTFFNPTLRSFMFKQWNDQDPEDFIQLPKFSLHSRHIPHTHK